MRSTPILHKLIKCIVRLTNISFLLELVVIADAQYMRIEVIIIMIL